MVHTIWFRFYMIWFRRDFFVSNVPVRPETKFWFQQLLPSHTVVSFSYQIIPRLSCLHKNSVLSGPVYIYMFYIYQDNIYYIYIKIIYILYIYKDNIFYIYTKIKFCCYNRGKIFLKFDFRMLRLKWILFKNNVGFYLGIKYNIVNDISVNSSVPMRFIILCIDENILDTRISTFYTWMIFFNNFKFKFRLISNRSEKCNYNQNLV